MCFSSALTIFIDRLPLASLPREGANKQVISSQADSLIKISRIWADFFPANTSNQPI
ncbi:ABC transporter [Citrobacter freundii complex sp. CFNIH9]|nr:ABC transporter [Citrobacter freundii complex sp. CFNIH9]